jgi:hypothetical protein
LGEVYGPREERKTYRKDQSVYFQVEPSELGLGLVNQMP